MAKEVKKQPAIHLMIGDYFKDPLLGQASLISRGVWYEVLMYMWEGDKRGVLETTPARLMQLVRGQVIEEILHFMNELHDIEFGGIYVDQNIDDLETTSKRPQNDFTFPILKQHCNIPVTLINRRMYADYKDRQNTRLRVEKHRRKRKKQALKRECNANGNGKVTVTTSVALATSLVLSKDKTASCPIFKWCGEYFKKIIMACEFIRKLPVINNQPFNPYQWTQQQINKNKHPGAILETLEALSVGWKRIEIGPWAYARSIIKTKDGNWHEKEHIRDHEEIKNNFKKFIIDNELSKLIDGIGG